jgi:gliding motility-associated lipoprotein GldH
MLKHLFFGATTLLLLWGVLGCESGVVVDQDKSLNSPVWTYRDSVQLDFDIADTTQLYQIDLHLTVADTFPTENIYLSLYTRFPSGTAQRVIRSFQLFDKFGAPVGRAASGGNSEYEFVLQENAYFNQVGAYRIAVGQYMRQDSLPGVSRVGVKIRATGKR